MDLRKGGEGLRGALCVPGVASAAVFVGALVAAIALTYPLVFSLSTAVAADRGDPILNTWLISWNARHAPFSSEWWNGPFFYPTSGALAFSEHIAGVGLLTS